MKKKIKVIIMLLSGLIIMVGTFAIAKYILDHRYLTYKELEPNQLILIREEMYESAEAGKMVNVRAIDAQGNLYSVYVLYEEWNGIEAFHEEITQGEKTMNYMTKEEMEKAYGYVMEIEIMSNYTRPIMHIPQAYTGSENKPFYREYCYAIRYRGNGTVEYVKFFEERTLYEYYYLDDFSAKKLRELVGGRL